MKDFIIATRLILTGILWIFILFNPVIISIVKDNWLWLFLYFVVPIQIIIGIFLSKILLDD